MDREIIARIDRLEETIDEMAIWLLQIAIRAGIDETGGLKYLLRRRLVKSVNKGSGVR